MMFVSFRCTTLSTQVHHYLNPTENLIFQFSVSDFHSVKSGLTKHVLLV